MRLFNVVVALGFLSVSGFAQTTADYLKFRNAQHIVQPTPGQKLDRITGQSVVEIQGKVQGSFKQGDTTQYLIERDDKETLVVECNAPLEWLDNGEVAVRMLLHVSRLSSLDPLVAKLILAAPEKDISKIDDAYWKAEASKVEAKHQTVEASPTTTLSSRGGGVDMHGWIGRAGRGHRPSPPVSQDAVHIQYRNFVLKQNPRIGLGPADEIARHVIKYSLAYRVDARLVMALILAESDFHPMETSKPGAMGLGQLMPETASLMGISNPYDLEQNLYATIKLLRHLMSEYGVDRYPVRGEAYYQAIGIVLAAYNAGEGAVRKFGGIPPYHETQHYVVKVISFFRQLTRKDGQEDGS